MINLIQYFDGNVKEDSYYGYHFFSLKYEERTDVSYYDDIEIIEDFKRIINPKNENNITMRLNDKFILICFYLYDNGYEIKQFPNFLHRPDNKCALYDFLFNNLYLSICEKKNILKRKLKLEDKITAINELRIEKKQNKINDELNAIFKKISTRNAEFNDMTEDEKLKEICNAIEYLLKEENKFIKLNYDDCLDILDDEKIRKFRNKLECYRHSSKKAIEERNQYTNFQKKLLIDYGIFVIETIYNKINI